MQSLSGNSVIPCDKRKFSGLGSRRPAYPISPISGHLRT
jgi:hypothetical protein